MERAFITENKGKGLLRGPLIALLFMAGFSLLSMAVASALLLKAENPSAWIRILGVLLPALTAFFGGIVCSKAAGGAGALFGLFSGILLVICLIVLAKITGENSISIAKSAVLYTALLLLSVLGGTLGAHKKSRKRRKKRR